MTDSPHQPYLAFRSKGFTRFFVGGLLVNMGMAAQSVAVGWEVYQRTHDALSLGMVGFVQALPMILFTLPAGYLADVYDRRKVVLAGMVGMAITSLLLVIFSVMKGSIELMYLLLFLDAACFRLAGPAAQSIVPMLVPEHVLENAIKWRASMYQVASVLGPAIGGFIIAVSVPSAYAFNAVATLVYVLILMTLHIPKVKQSQPGRMLAQLREGIDYVWHHKVVLGALSLDLFAVLLGGAVYLLPVYVCKILVDRPLGLTPETALGWLRAAPFLGASVMGLILAHRPPMKRAGTSLFASVAAFGVATIIFGISKNFWLSFAMLFLTGFFDNISVVIRQTLVQLRTPSELRGRVLAVNSMFIGASNELGGFESGLVAKLAGSAVRSVVIGGVGTLAVVGAWMKMFPELRRFGRLAGEPEKDADVSHREHRVH